MLDQNTLDVDMLVCTRLLEETQTSPSLSGNKNQRNQPAAGFVQPPASRSDSTQGGITVANSLQG